MNNKQKSTIGPVQLLVIGFNPDAKYEGKILKELEQLDKIKTIRILDLLFVKKNQDSKDLIALSVQEEKMGAIVGALMGFSFKDEEQTLEKPETDTETNAFGLSTKQIEAIGESLAPGMAAGVLLIEHVWARDLKDAIRKAGGVPLAEGFLTPEAITAVAKELNAITQTLDELEKEDAQTHSPTRVYN